jgi:hypothetical protein
LISFLLRNAKFGSYGDLRAAQLAGRFVLGSVHDRSTVSIARFSALAN